MDKWALYFVAVGIILVVAGAWTYQSAQPAAAADQLFQPAECPDGNVYLVNPAYLATDYRIKIYGYYQNIFTVEKAADYRMSLIIGNDPCAEGTAQIVIVTPQGATVQPVPVVGAPEVLASYMIAPAALLEGGVEAAVETGMGVFPAKSFATVQNMVFTQYGTIEDRLITLYYDTTTGLLVRQDDARHVLVSLQPMPQSILIVRSLEDYGRAPGPQGEITYAGTTAEILAVYSLAGGLGVVAGLASIAYGAWLLLYRPPEP